MDELNYEQRLTRVEERSKSNQHRLDDLEPLANDMHKLAEGIVKITVEMKHTNEDVRFIKDRVENLEQEPAKKWKDSTKALFNALLGAIGTAVAGGILWLIAQAV